MKHAWLLFALAGCVAPEERLGTSRAAIVKGEPSDDAQDATVLVMHYDALAKGGGAASGCTGTLLAPTLVLTARHCVAITDPSAACSENGEAIEGGVVRQNHTPSAIFVFGGKERPDFLSGDLHPSRGVEILDTGAKNLCNHDIALVVLDTPLKDTPIAPVKLDGLPAAGTLVDVVGWGVSEAETDPKVRLQRRAVQVLDVGPARLVGPAEFTVGEGPCQGDSGGPALAPSGAVLGALSRGGVGGKGVEGCLATANVYSSVAGHADFLRAGYARVNQRPWLEGEPNPLLAGPESDDGGCRTSPRGGADGAIGLAAVAFAVGSRRLRRHARRG